MGLNWEYLFEQLGRKVGDDLADQLDELADDAQAKINEVREFTDILRHVGPFTQNIVRRCDKCNAILRKGEEHVCDDAVEAETQ